MFRRINAPTAGTKSRSENIHFESGDLVEGCVDCRKNKGFTIHHSLIDAFRNRDVAVFAGAGVSTENSGVMSHTFFDEICALVGADRTKTTFPDAMQMVVDQPNGRIELVTKIKKHLEYVDSFPELYQAASEFHRELATMFMVDTIITTNWDCIFERECAAQPFVNDADMAFWDAVERRVELLPVRLTPA